MGGPVQMPDGAPAVKAISWLEVETNLNRFDSLPPYNRDLTVKIATLAKLVIGLQRKEVTTVSPIPPKSSYSAAVINNSVCIRERHLRLTGILTFRDFIIRGRSRGKRNLNNFKCHCFIRRPTWPQQ